MSDLKPSAGARLPGLKLLLRVNLLSGLRRVKSLKQQSGLLTGVIFLFIASYLVLAFWLFFIGLRFLGRFPALGTLLIERLLFLLFAFLFLLLLLSNLVISYTNLFRNRETTFLLSLPLPARTIFQWKFIESTLLASWAFIFLIAPLLGAYGLTRGVAWHFYFVTLLLIVLLVVLPGVAGSFVAVNVARFLDRRLFQVLTILCLLAFVAVTAYWFRPEPAASMSEETRVGAVLEKMLGRTHFAQYSFLPSYWLSSSVLNWADGAITAALFFVLVLLSHSLFFGMLAFTRMGGLFYDAISTVQSRGSALGRWAWFRARLQRREQGAPSIGLLERAVNRLSWMRPDVRALLVKDTRMFWRDTTQWAQSLVLFGLLAVYILNLRHFSQQLTNPFWLHLVWYLNLGACSLNLATLTTRFVYPQFSLEGKRLWIIGLAPLGMVQVVKAKYWLAAGTSLIVTLGLILLSCYMLDMPWYRTIYFAFAITIMTLTLTGLAVGLGALYPNLKEENPSKIVSGFGGTFCLVLSFLYILGSVVLLAMASPLGTGRNPSAPEVLACLSGFVVLSACLGWLPVRLGLQRVREFEL
jgi:ABC-2 type transport system permease protein